MADPTYRIEFDGEIAEGYELADVKATIAEAFMLDNDQVDEMFSGKPMRKTNLSKEKAARMSKIFKLAGAVCRVESEGAAPASLGASPAQAPGATMSCPKCGKQQQKADNCVACGVAIAKFSSLPSNREDLGGDSDAAFSAMRKKYDQASPIGVGCGSLLTIGGIGMLVWPTFGGMVWKSGGVMLSVLMIVGGVAWLRNELGNRR